MTTIGSDHGENYNFSNGKMDKKSITKHEMKVRSMKKGGISPRGLHTGLES